MASPLVKRLRARHSLVLRHDPVHLYWPAHCSLGLRVVLSPQPSPGSEILSVDAGSPAYRAGLHQSDTITGVECDGRHYHIATGEDLINVAADLRGRWLLVHVVRFRPSWKDRAATMIASAWRGHEARAMVREECVTATGGSRAASIRAPPRLSVGDADE